MARAWSSATGRRSSSLTQGLVTSFAPTIGLGRDNMCKSQAQSPKIIAAMKRWRWWALFLLLYISADFCDPSIPGVFFFDSSHFFMDGIVEAKALSSAGMTGAPSATPTADQAVTPSLPPRLVLARADVPKFCWWRPMKCDCLSSSGSRSPEDH